MNLNDDDQSIRIPRSKSKLILLFFISVGFGGGGFWFIKEPMQFANDDFHHQPVFMILFVGGISIIFSIAGIVVNILQFFSRSPGLVIDGDGITIVGLSSSSVGWRDISKFDITDISRTRLISIYLTDTEEYINREPRKWRRNLMRLTYKRYGSPLSLTTSNLDCDFDDLYDLLTTRLKEYKEAEKIIHFKDV